jgi:predicted ester cyclase
VSHGGFPDREALRAAAEAFVEAGWHRRDLAAVRAAVHPDYRYELVGRDAEVAVDWYLNFLRMLHDALTDLEVDLADAVVDGAEAMLHLVISGRQVRPLFGIPAKDDGGTGALDVMIRLTFRDGKVWRQTTVADFSRLQTLLRG